MLAMALAGFTMAVGRGIAPAANVPVALLTSYLVITSLTAVRPISWWSRRWDVGLLLVVVGPVSWI